MCYKSITLCQASFHDHLADILTIYDASGKEGVNSRFHFFYEKISEIHGGKAKNNERRIVLYVCMKECCVNDIK